MYFVPIKSIKIENRIRREFDPAKISELAASIQSKGLMHPPVLRYNENLEFVLVAGERRIRAMTYLHENKKSFMYSFLSPDGVKCTQPVPPGMIPASMVGELSPLEISEAELEENTIRADLTWQEKAAYYEKLHNHRVLQHGPFDPSKPDEKKGWSVTDTAEEILGRRTGYTGEVSNLLTLAKNLDDKEISTAATPKEAMRVLRKKATKFLMEQLANNVKDENALVKVKNIDARGALLNIQSNQYDCIITDPPYAISADSFGSQSALGHDYNDSPEETLELLQVICTESFRITKAQAHLYMFCAFERFNEILDMLRDAGWQVWPRPLIWSKGTGMLAKPDYGPRYTYECIIFANKGKRPVLVSGMSDVLEFPAVAGKLLQHAAEKPVDLMKNLLSRSCMPGDKILDPCAGTGSTLAAAKLLRIEALGFEVNTDTYNIAVNRLSEV
ncbi:MAG: DNA methyltransferase [Minisyncoccota bacterium]